MSELYRSFTHHGTATPLFVTAEDILQYCITSGINAREIERHRTIAASGSGMRGGQDHVRGLSSGLFDETSQQQSIRRSIQARRFRRRFQPGFWAVGIPATPGAHVAISLICAVRMPRQRALTLASCSGELRPRVNWRNNRMTLIACSWRLSRARLVGALKLILPGLGSSPTAIRRGQDMRAFEAAEELQAVLLLR